METVRITIALTVPVTSSLSHQLRNLAEDLAWHDFASRRYAEVENADTATDAIRVRVQSLGKLNEARSVIEARLAEHLLSDRCDILVEGD